VEKITDSVERSSAAGWPANQRVERSDQSGPIRRQMQVGDKQRGRRLHVSACVVSLCDFGSIDDHVVFGHVLMHAAVAGGHGLDAVDYFGAGDDVAEDAITPAIGVG